jgi:hypothetical protein
VSVDPSNAFLSLGFAFTPSQVKLNLAHTSLQCRLFCISRTNSTWIGKPSSFRGLCDPGGPYGLSECRTAEGFGGRSSAQKNYTSKVAFSSRILRRNIRASTRTNATDSCG